MVTIPFAEWTPDQPDFANPGAAHLTNVYPRTAQSYGPVQALSNVYNALTARCQGAIGMRDNAGNPYVFAGDATKLYQQNGSAAAWANVSGTTYTINSDEFWRFAQFDTLALATNISDGIQACTFGDPPFNLLSSGAPKARYIATTRNFLMVGNTNDGTNGARAQRVWWSAIGDPTNWPAPGTSAAASVQSDAQDIVGEHGWLTGIVPHLGPVDAALFFERAVFRAMYIGAPDIWGFYPASNIRGCAAPGTIAWTEDGAIFLGPDDFYLFDGNQAIGIGYGKVAKTFYNTVNQTFLTRSVSVIDPLNKIYWLAFPSLASATGALDTVWACAYGLQSVLGTTGRWSQVTGLTALQFLFRAPSFGYNEETGGPATGFNTDTSPFGPDSRFWTGNSKEQFAGFDSTNTMGIFNGTNLAPTLETTETEPIKGRRSIIVNAIPLIDGGTPVITPYTRNRLTDNTASFTAGTMNAYGFCPIRSEGRFHRLSLALSSGSTWGHAQGIEIPDADIIDGGMR